MTTWKCSVHSLNGQYSRIYGGTSCVPTIAASKSFSSVASNIWNSLPSHLSSIPALPAPAEELSNITCSCLLTLTVVRNLVRPNQLNLSRFVIHRQLLPSHSSEMPCRPSKGVPSERLRLVKWFISHRLHTGACVNLVLLTYLLTHIVQASTLAKHGRNRHFKIYGDDD